MQIHVKALRITIVSTLVIFSGTVMAPTARGSQLNACLYVFTFYSGGNCGPNATLSLCGGCGVSTPPGCDASPYYPNLDYEYPYGSSCMYRMTSFFDPKCSCSRYYCHCQHDDACSTEDSCVNGTY